MTYLDRARQLYPDMKPGRILRSGCPDALPELKITLRCLTQAGADLPEECAACWARKAEPCPPENRPLSASPEPAGTTNEKARKIPEGLRAEAASRPETSLDGISAEIAAARADAARRGPKKAPKMP